ncbi:MAG: hypothetical protein HKN43_00575, partial [Rhodothermales bacterium]|nr:hypothetical protein [Rhodothermales bacterium]
MIDKAVSFDGVPYDQWIERVKTELRKSGKEFNPYWTMAQDVPIERIPSRPTSPSRIESPTSVWQTVLSSGLSTRDELKAAMRRASADSALINLSAHADRSAIDALVDSQLPFGICGSTEILVPILERTAGDKLLYAFFQPPDSHATISVDSIIDLVDCTRACGYSGAIVLIADDSGIKDQSARLASMLSRFRDAIDALISAGLDAGAATTKIVVQISTGSDFVADSIRLRALRLGLNRILMSHHCDPDEANPVIWATTETEKDPDDDVYLVRETLARASAALAGVHAMVVRDSPSAHFESSVTHLLAHESNLHAARDPFASSFFVESGAAALLESVLDSLPEEVDASTQGVPNGESHIDPSPAGSGWY